MYYPPQTIHMSRVNEIDEIVISELLTWAWKCSVIFRNKNKKTEHIDTELIYRGNRYLGEFRRRGIPSTGVESLWVNVDKWVKCKAIRDEMNIGLLFIVRFTDGLFFLEEDFTTEYKICSGINHTRTYHTDTQDVYNIPITKFVKIMDVSVLQKHLDDSGIQAWVNSEIEKTKNKKKEN